MANPVNLNRSNLEQTANNDNVRPSCMVDEMPNERLQLSTKPRTQISVAASDYPSKPIKSCLKKSLAPNDTCAKPSPLTTIDSLGIPRKVKGILKKETESSRGSNTSFSNKAVSWCDLNRWSEGSEVDLDALVARARRARSRRVPRKNATWEKSTSNTKSNSMVNLSDLDKHLQRYKAPTKPLRQISTEIHKQKRNDTPNPFQAAVTDFQNTLERQATSAANSSNSKESSAPPRRPNRRGSDLADPSLIEEYKAAKDSKYTLAPKRPNRRESTLVEETASQSP